MSTYIKILSKKEIIQFNSPPEFTGEERKKYFNIPEWANIVIKSLRNKVSKIGFLIQLGYFKSANKFFLSSQFCKSSKRMGHIVLKVNRHFPFFLS
jgi:Domain of unknown function (DUF4158)